MDDIEYTYLINEIVDDTGDGAIVVNVTYRAADERLQEITRNVTVPVHKVQSAERAEEVMDVKIRSRAPTAEWAEALRLVDRTPGPPREDVLKHLETRVGTNRKVEKPRQPRPERIGSGGSS